MDKQKSPLLNERGRPYVAVDLEPGYNIQWWLDRGIQLGPTGDVLEVYISAIRDMSGRYTGFIAQVEGNHMPVDTIEAAEGLIQRYAPRKGNNQQEDNTEYHNRPAINELWRMYRARLISYEDYSCHAQLLNEFRFVGMFNIVRMPLPARKGTNQ